MDKVQDKHEFVGFPDEFVSPKKKSSPDYGKKMAKAIYNRYRHNHSYYTSINRQYVLNRKYAEGLQSIDKFKDLLNVNGDVSYLNLDWSAVPIIPKYVDILQGEMINQDYKILCNPIDVESRTMFDDERDKRLAYMKIKQFSDQIKEVTGIPIIDDDEYVPRSKDELELHMQMNYKQAHAIAMEEALEYVFLNNDWKEIAKQAIRDSIVIKKLAVRVYWDENNNIRMRYSDPARHITSFSEKPDYSNVKYIAEIIQMPLHELRRLSYGTLKEEQLYEIAKQNSGKYGNPSMNFGANYREYYQRLNYSGVDNYTYNSFLVPVLDFGFHTIDIKKWEKRKNNYDGYYYNEKDYDYQPEEGVKEREITEKELDMTYEGMWVIGTEYMIQYGLSRFMPREKIAGTYSPNTSLPWIIYAPDIYDMENKSLVERMIPHADQIQLCHLKIQQLLAKVSPPGIAWDVSALKDVILGKGRDAATPLELQDIYYQTGVAYYNGEMEDGTPMNRKPIDVINNSVAGQIQEVIASYNFHMDMIRQITGLNEARDASTPDKDSLVGVQKIMLAGSRNATRPLNEAFKNIYERTAKRASLMVMDSLYYGNAVDGFINAIGEYNVEILTPKDPITSWEFGIRIEAQMDEEQRAQLETDIQNSLKRDELRPEDASMIRQIRNSKLAVQYMVQRRKQYSLEKEAEKENEARRQQEIVQASAQAEMAKLQAKAQANIMEEAEIMAIKEQYDRIKHEREKEKIILQGQLKTGHIEVAAEEEFKNTALTKEVKQEPVFTNPAQAVKQ